jgi:hypothetical protein
MKGHICGKMIHMRMYGLFEYVEVCLLLEII